MSHSKGFITLYQWYEAYPECRHGWFTVISTTCENEFAWKSANKIWLFLSKIPLYHSQSLATCLELDTATWKQNTNPVLETQTLASIGEASYDDLFWRSDVYALTPNALLFSTGYPKRKL